MARQPVSAAKTLAFATVVSCLVFAVTYSVNMLSQLAGLELLLRPLSEPVRLLIVFSFTCGLPLVAFGGMILWAVLANRA